MKKEQNITFRTTEDEANEYTDVAQKLDVPLSQIAREALRAHVAKLKKTHPKLKEQTTSQAAG